MGTRWKEKVAIEISVLYIEEVMVPLFDVMEWTSGRLVEIFVSILLLAGTDQMIKISFPGSTITKPANVRNFSGL